MIHCRLSRVTHPGEERTLVHISNLNLSITLGIPFATKLNLLINTINNVNRIDSGAGMMNKATLDYHFKLPPAERTSSTAALCMVDIPPKRDAVFVILMITNNWTIILAHGEIILTNKALQFCSALHCG